MRPDRRRCLAALACLAVSPAAAADPVIEAGREAEVMALLRPYTLGADVSGGWRLMFVRIQRDSIRVELSGPQQAKAWVDLHHPDATSPGSKRTPSFAVTARGQPAAEPAVAKLIAAVAANDDGHFWRAAAQGEPREPGASPSRGSGRAAGIGFPLATTALGAVAVAVIVRRAR